MNTAAYAEALERYVEELETGYGDIMMENNITLGKKNYWYPREKTI